jgi:hypothetical protein
MIMSPTPWLKIRLAQPQITLADIVRQLAKFTGFRLNYAYRFCRDFLDLGLRMASSATVDYAAILLEHRKLAE